MLHDSMCNTYDKKTTSSDTACQILYDSIQ